MKSGPKPEPAVEPEPAPEPIAESTPEPKPKPQPRVASNKPPGTCKRFDRLPSGGYPASCATQPAPKTVKAVSPPPTPPTGTRPCNLATDRMPSGKWLPGCTPPSETEFWKKK